MALGPLRSSLVFMALLPLSFMACKNNTSESKVKDLTATTQDSAVLAFTAPLHEDIRKLYASIQGQETISYNALFLLDRLVPNSEVSETFSLNRQVQRSTKHGFKDVSVDETFAAMRIGDKGLVFHLKLSKSWAYFDQFPLTIIEGKSLKEKAEFYLDTKYFEPERIQRSLQLVNSAEFVANFVPGYVGAKNVAFGDSTKQVFLGVAQFVGDIGTLGLGSKINILRKSAATIVLTAASARVASSLNDVLSGQSSVGSSIDGVLAMVEGALAFTTFVKVDLTELGGAVRNLDEATLLGNTLKRSPEDILRNGLTKAELESLGVAIARKIEPIANVTAKPSLLTRLTGSASSSRFSVNEMLPNLKDEIAIGFEGAHVFLQVGVRRFDTAPLHFLRKRLSNSTEMRSGVLIHLKGLDPATKKRIFENIESVNISKAPDITCAAGACSILSKLGDIHVGRGGLIENAMPSDVLKSILGGRLTGPGGTALKFDMFFTPEVSLKQYIAHTANVETALKTAMGTYFGTLVSLQFVGHDPEIAFIIGD